jgi:mono/diheme cytochrome c family protein
MRAAVLILALALASCDSPAKVAFADASLTLPEDPMELPEGPGRDAVLENCTACHSPSTMLQQPKVPREKWESIVGKMKKLYKAPVDDAAVPAIAGYMVTVQARQNGAQR